MANKPITITNKSRALMIRETITSYLFLAPFLVFFVMFVIYPMFMCVYTSFFDATMGREDIFIGFQNCRQPGNIDPLAGGEKDIAVYLVANEDAIGFYEKLGMKKSTDVMQYNKIDWTEFVVE